MKHVLLTLLIAAMAVMPSCKVPTKISHQNLAFIYREDIKPMHPVFSLFHKKDSTTEITFKIKSSEVLYSRKGQDDAFSARLAFQYRIYGSFEQDVIYDSLTHYVDFKGENGVDQLLQGSFPVHAPAGKECLLEIKTSDLNRKEYTLNYLPVKRMANGNNQYYRLYAGGGDMIIARRHLALGEDFKLEVPPKHNGKIFVRYYNREAPLPPPPFSLNNVHKIDKKADSLFTLEVRTDNTITSSLDKKGFYLFCTDTSNYEGITLFAFGADFPKVTTTQAYLQPLRFITTQQEFEKIMEGPDQRANADEFWRNSGTNDDRSAELIQKYYSRVEEANAYFTSYCEGWKTDRGLVYIIFGPPNVIYKTSTSESWIYGEEQNALSTQFTFSKVANPFTDNDYSLNRYPNMKNTWYRTVDSWRQGRIY